MSSAPQQTTASRKKTKSRGRAGRVTFILLITFIALTLIGGSAYAYHILNMDTYYRGVSIDGVEVGELTVERAKELLYQHYHPVLNEIQIRIQFEDHTWEYDHQSIQTSVNIEEVAKKAWLVGRTGSYFDRLKEIYYTNKTGVSFQTELIYDTDVLKNDIEAIAAELYIAPVDASITFHNKEEEQFTFTPEVIGRQIAAEEILSSIKEKTDKWDFSPYVIIAETLHPQFTLEEVQTWTSKIAVFETSMTNAAERNHNITLSSSSYDGVRVDPGQVFSMNEATGPRGSKEGYKNAPVIVGGRKLEDEPGGGNCQTSTTLYGAVARADMEIVERWPHSFPIAYTDVGQDAMVDYPNFDIKFRNPKDSPVFISRTVRDNRLIVEVYGKASTDYDTIDLETKVLSRSSTPQPQVIKDSSMFEDQTVVEYKSRPEIKTQTYRIYYKDGKEVKRVPEQYSLYRKVTGKVRVGTKPRPVEQPEESNNSEDEG